MTPHTDRPTPIDLATIEASTAELPLVGYTIFWRLAGLRVKHQNLCDLLEQFGLKTFAPDPPTPRKALRRALEAWIASKEASAAAASGGAGGEDHQQRTLIRVINQAGRENLVFALVAEDVNLAQLGLSYATDLRILLEKKTGAMVCTTTSRGAIDAFTESQRVSAELSPFWGEYKDLHVAGDLSETIISIVTGMEATSLRRSGGLYFVPRSRQGDLERLRAFVAALPHADWGEPFVCAVGVPDTAKTKKQMAQALHAGMMDEVGAAVSDLKRITESSDTVREKTVQQRLLAYRRLKARAQIYADLLEMNQEAIRSAVSRLEAQARALLMKDDASATLPGVETDAGSQPTPASTEMHPEPAPASWP